MSVKLLNEHNLEFLSLTGDCPGSSESAHVKMPHCWKSHVTAHILVKQVSSLYAWFKMLSRIRGFVSIVNYFLNNSINI